jgi:polysaccharide export outer membrane protein
MDLAIDGQTPLGPLPWDLLAQGEYIGPARGAHVPDYRLRVGDRLEFVYRLTGDTSAMPYRLNVGDTIRVESLTDSSLDRVVIVQPDGFITLPQIGEVPAAGRPLTEMRSDLNERYRQFIKEPSITVTPTKLNTRLEELRATVDSRAGSGGQARQARVTPEGTIQLPAIGSVPANGLSLAELKYEVDQRYNELIVGIEVTPILVERAPTFIYVLGEVRSPGRFTLEGPTTLLQAVSLAGSWNVGANLKEVIVFRRDENWQMIATKVSIYDALYKRNLCAPGEQWLRDADIVVVPKSPILVADDFIELVFTRGIYGIVPFNMSLSYFKDLSTLGLVQ